MKITKAIEFNETKKSVRLNIIYFVLFYMFKKKSCLLFCFKCITIKEAQ